VKILADPDAENGRMDTPRMSPIAELRAMASPFYSETSLRSAAEVQVVAVRMLLLRALSELKRARKQE